MKALAPGWLRKPHGHLELLFYVASCCFIRPLESECQHFSLNSVRKLPLLLTCGVYGEILFVLILILGYVY